MKALIIILYTVLSANLAFAGKACLGLFEIKSAHTSIPNQNEKSFESKFNHLLKTRDSIESMASKKMTNAQIVKAPIAELKTEIQTQIELLENAKKDLTTFGDFLRQIIELQQANLSKLKNAPLNLEQYFRASLKTMLLLDQKVEYSLDSSNYKMTALEQTRLEAFLKDKISDKDFVKSFPDMKEFFTEWNKSIKSNSTESQRILFFTSVDTKIPEFNKLLSPDISIIGLVDYASHPDGTPNKEGPVGFAKHDLSHHDLNRTQARIWKNDQLTFEQRRALLFEIRKNYLAVRKNLNLKEKMSLDILYFEFFHEDTNIFAKYIKVYRKSNGTFKDPYNLQTARILTYSEVVGIGLSSKVVFPHDMKESTLSTAGSNPIQTLHRTMKPSWDLMTEIWSKSYDSLENQ